MDILNDFGKIMRRWMIVRKCLVWGTGEVFWRNILLLQFYEVSGIIKIIGVTSKDDFYESILSYRYIYQNQIKDLDFDYIICSVDDTNMKKIQDEATGMGIDSACIIPIRVMALPGFDFDKYISIRNNVPTIITPHCWGGVTYNSLALPFASPFINMFENHDDYLKLLKNIKYYMECPLEFVEIKYDLNLKRYFPVAKCGDIHLFFNHYESFEEAEKCWNRRKKRVNWENLFIEFFDTDIKRVDEFLSLPYEKKICFVPFPMKEKNVISLDYTKSDNNMFWRTVMKTAKSVCYDVFELLLNNEVVLLSDYKSRDLR